MRIDSPQMTNAVITGSFSGSFVGVGNFTGLEADSVEYANVLNKPTLVSGSAQLAADISGSFTSLSASIASDIAGLDGSYATDAELNASSSALTTAYRSELNASSSALISAYGSADTTLSSSLAADIASNLSSIGTLQSDSATKAELNASSSALISAYGSADTTLSSSLAADIASNLSSINSIGSFTASLDTDLTTLSLPANTTISSFGASLVDDANAAAAIATLGLDADLATLSVPASTTISAFGKTLVDDADAATAIATLGLDADIATFSVPASTTISAFGKTLVDDADASAARTTLGVDAAGTDNSTDVTLVTTSHDYLSITGQAITLGTIDISDDTNLAVSDTTGQTGINLTLTGDTISGVVSGLTTTSNVQFNNLTVAGNLTVTGTTTSINSTNLDVTDKLISINKGGADAASANGAGLFISGANESITWDNGNSRFNLSDDIHAEGNITLTGTVDGRDVAADGSKLDGIESSAKDDQTITAGTGLTGGGTGDVTISHADTSTQASVNNSGRTYIQDITLDGFGHVTAIASATETVTDTTYSAGSGIDLTGTTFSVAAGSGLTQEASGLAHADTSTQASVNNSGRTFIQDITLDGFGHVTAITSATDADTYVGTVTSVATGTGLTGGTITSTGTISLSHLGFQTLTDPNADRIAFWDDSAGSFAWLSAGTNITISGTTISATDTNTTYSAGTGISLVGTTFSNSGVTSITAGSGISVNASTGGVTVTNTITNNNQLTNGAGYTTYSANQTLDNTSNVHFEGLMVGQTTGATANTIRCVGDVVAYYSSDAQFKDNVVQLEGALDKVKQIRGVEFDWNDKQDVHTGHDIGVIAQEVEAVYPELVHHREHNDSKAVDYVKLTAVLIEAVKELAAKVEELEKK